ncbi:MAG: hypothetical protein ACK5SX_11805 [Sandaracinobacter sp.]
MRFSAVILLAIGLAGCGGTGAEPPGAATQRGIDRSVADIRAAEAALQAPVKVSRSVGELTGKTVETVKTGRGEAKAAPRGNAKAKAAADPADPADPAEPAAG